MKKIFSTLFVLSSFAGIAQTTYLPLNNEDYQTLDRLETRYGSLSDDLFLFIKPVPRQGEVRFLEDVQTKSGDINLSKIDQYNIEHAISVSGEWAENEDGAINSKHPWFHTFYTKQPDMYHLHTDDFFLASNAVITGQLISENYNDGTGSKSQTLYASSRGVEIRGWIAKRLGFYTFLADNQEQPVSFVKKWAGDHKAVPGASLYLSPSAKTFDYLQARGYIDFAAIKDHINITFGYDKHFLGDGYRSLFLSDFAAPSTFLRFNTKIWKINYQNLFLELTPQFTPGNNEIISHKYAAMHHLSVNVTRWLNMGVFEAVIFDRAGNFEFSYLNPIIFYRAVEHANNSSDNELLGFNFKVIAAKHIQLYGQFLLDELKTSELFSSKGWWGNKYGIQLGAKYFDAFTLKNLDLQAELNIVRPYTYSHFDSISNYTTYNQPLAHPLGAGFEEFVGIVKYQPLKNLYLTLKGMYYMQGADTGAANFGSDIFKSYGTRYSEYGVHLINGIKTNCTSINLNASYELKENLFIDLGFTTRNFQYENNLYPQNTSTYFYGGVRLNLARREYDFY